MVVGVNGVGKTTTIGKLAARFTAQGRSVLIAAGDTFRAAAAISWPSGPSAPAPDHPAQGRHRSRRGRLDAVEARWPAYRCGDRDTAGRLHTKVNLMEEIKKVKRSIAKRLPEAPHECCWSLTPPRPERPLPGAPVSRGAGGERNRARQAGRNRQGWDRHRHLSGLQYTAAVHRLSGNPSKTCRTSIRAVRRGPVHRWMNAGPLRKFRPGATSRAPRPPQIYIDTLGVFLY